MKKKTVLIMASVVAWAMLGAALASDDLSDARNARLFEMRKHEKTVSSSLFGDELTPSEIYRRTQEVLEHYGVPAETQTQSSIDAFQSFQTEEGLRDLLPFMDPTSELLTFSALNSSSLDVFQDRNVRKVGDFSVNLRDSGTAAPQDDFVSHLQAAQSNDADHPLQGLRIALDPGHMGSDSWDLITGKYVLDSSGHKVSEGVINLQTALLLEKQLQALGAETLLTHRGLRPATDADYKSFDIHQAGLIVLREQSLEDWFTGLLSTASDGEELFSAFDRQKEFREIFSEGNRPTLYNDYDLQARVDAMRGFKPDIAMSIHYDAAEHLVASGPAFSHDNTKAYVVGAYESSELASRNDRLEMASHLVDEASWRASVALAHELVTTLSGNLHIPLDKSSPGNVKQVEPGVFARNLAVLRHHYVAASTLVECAYYQDPGEFAELLKATHPMIIDGENHPYSDRVMQVANSLRQAIVQFVEKADLSAFKDGHLN